MNVFNELLIRDITQDCNSWITKDMTGRIIDDFVFLMIFCGNDFMPQIPFLNITANCIQLMINAYIELLQEKRRFIVSKSKPDVLLLQQILNKVKVVEETTFQQNKHDYLTSLQGVLETEVHGPQQQTLRAQLATCTAFAAYRRLYYQIKLGVDVSGRRCNPTHR